MLRRHVHDNEENRNDQSTIADTSGFRQDR
jgi:hypothetical protein